MGEQPAHVCCLPNKPITTSNANPPAVGTNRSPVSANAWGVQSAIPIPNPALTPRKVRRDIIQGSLDLRSLFFIVTKIKRLHSGLEILASDPSAQIAKHAILDFSLSPQSSMEGMVSRQRCVSSSIGNSTRFNRRITGSATTSPNPVIGKPVAMQSDSNSP